MAITPVRWTTSDLELFAGDSRTETLRERRNRYEIIDGELFVTKSPHWDHQSICRDEDSLRLYTKISTSHHRRQLF